MVPQNCSVSLILQNIFLCVQNENIHTGLELHWGGVNDDRIFIFGWTISLSVLKHYMQSALKCIILKYISAVLQVH